MLNPPAGWYAYPDPAQPGSLRYSDGFQWTSHVHLPAAAPPTSPRRSPGKIAAAIIVPVALFFLLGIALIVYLGFAIVCGEAPHYCS